MPRKQSKKRVTRRKPNKVMTALQKLRRMKPNQQRQALTMSNDAFIRQMCTQVKRLRNANVSPAISKRMQKQRKNLQKFIRPKTSASVKRKMLTQRGGGFLPLLLSVLPTLGAMVGNFIGGARKRR